jgi:hypothetical protein
MDWRNVYARRGRKVTDNTATQKLYFFRFPITLFVKRLQ